jgi:hypothetical protein
MELAYTVIFLVFVINWFARYNTISLIFLFGVLNLIRNVDIYIKQNNITETPNPFFKTIILVNRVYNWSSSKILQISRYYNGSGIFNWIANKYDEYNNYYIELLTIGQQQMLIQANNGFKYTLTTVMTPQLKTNLILGTFSSLSAKSIKTTNKEINELNKEHEKKKCIDIKRLDNMMKELDKSVNNSEKRIELFDSDDDILYNNSKNIYK